MGRSSLSSSSSRSSSRSSCSARRMHLWCAWITALPLLMSVCSGMAYRISRTLGADKSRVRWLLRVHTLESLGLRAYYPLLLFCMLLSLLLTGFTMTSMWGWFCRNCCCGCGPRRRSGSGTAEANRSLEQAVEQYERAAAAAAAAGSSAGGAGAQKGLLAGSNGVSISDSGGAAAATAVAGDESEWSGSESGRSGLGGLADDDDFLRRRVPLHSTSRWTLAQRLSSWLPRHFTARWMHRTLGTVVLLPLALTASTGAMWIWASDWLYWEKQQYAMLMYLHEGRYVEGSGTVYVAIIGTATVGLILAGAVMLWSRVRSARRSGGGLGGGGAERRYITAPIVHASAPSSASHLASASPPHVASDDPESESAFLSPSSLETRRTMARIHKAFDLDHSGEGDETEDEASSMHSPQTAR